MTAKGSMPPLRKSQRRTLEELLDDTVALREKAKRHRLDLVHYIMHMAASELKDILAGEHPSRTPPLSSLPAAGGEQTHPAAVSSGDVARRMDSLRRRVGARLESSAALSGETTRR